MIVLVYALIVVAALLGLSSLVTNDSARARVGGTAIVAVSALLAHDVHRANWSATAEVFRVVAVSASGALVLIALYWAVVCDRTARRPPTTPPPGVEFLPEHDEVQR